ncbi:sialidase family protein [Angustibacter aerolatus]
MPRLPRLLTAALAGALTAAGLVAVAPSPAQAATSCTWTPFRSSPAAKRWYRIPSVVRTGSGALVAFAERRDRVLGDDGDFDVVTARSTDGGCTWSGARAIGDDGPNRVSNPVPVVDAATGRVLVLSVVTPRAGGRAAHKGLHVQTSRDDGRTFSALGAPVRPSGTYRGGLTGPGHAVQLTRSHVGRIVVPLGYRTSAGRYGAYGIYSDDHGATWRTGYDQQDTTGRARFMEGTVAEQSDGSLFISYRLQGDGAAAGTARQHALSTDGGQTLRRRFTRSSLPIVTVQGSALALPSGQLLFSAPADRTPTLRRDMTVFSSSTRGSTWNRGYQVELESTPGSYSDLVLLDARTVGILYETGTSTWKERIRFRRLAIAQLTKPTKVPSTTRVSRSTRPTRATSRARVKVTVTVRGIHSPPGRVTVTAKRGSVTRTTSVRLTYSNRGLRVLTLPRLQAGSWRLSVRYGGTGRIAASTRAAGTLKVVR